LEPCVLPSYAAALTALACRFWDYHSGNRFQDEQTIVQPGSLESEAGINCMTFDVSGSRLITGEVDKTIKREPPSCKFCPCLEQMGVEVEGRSQVEEQ